MTSKILCVAAVAVLIVCSSELIRYNALATEVATTNSTREELLKLERTWNDAYNRHDKEGVGRILHDDYVLIDADAYVLNKQRYLDTITRVQIKSEDLKFPNVRVYGDAAIVNSIWSGTYSFDGKDTTETIHYTDVFIRENGKWQAVSSQGTRVLRR